jgi:sec-independent protein translocase protein TatB
MFDIGWGELLVIGMVALIAIGPKELPTVLRSLGQWMGKIKRMANEFQGQFQEALREAELSDLKKHADELTSAVTDATKFDPLADLDKSMETDADTAAPAESAPASLEAPHADAETAAHDASPVAEPAAASAPEEELPPIDVPPPEAPAPVTEKDFAPVEPQPEEAKQAGGKA